MKTIPAIPKDGRFYRKIFATKCFNAPQLGFRRMIAAIPSGDGLRTPTFESTRCGRVGAHQQGRTVPLEARATATWNACSLGVVGGPKGLKDRNLRDASEIERSVTEIAPAPYGGLLVTASPLSDAKRHLFAALAAQHKLPAVYYEPQLRYRRRADLLRA